MIQAARDKVAAALLQGRKQALEWKDQNLIRLDAVRKEKEQMKSEYMGLYSAIHDNNRPLMLAETRMDIRAQKPNMDQETDESNRTYDTGDSFPSTMKLNCLMTIHFWREIRLGIILILLSVQCFKRGSDIDVFVAKKMEKIPSLF